MVPITTVTTLYELGTRHPARALILPSPSIWLVTSEHDWPCLTSPYQQVSGVKHIYKVGTIIVGVYTMLARQSGAFISVV